MDTVRRSFRTRKYLALQDKENKLMSTPEYVRKRPDIENLMEEGNCTECVTDRRGPPKVTQIQRPPNRRTSMISTRGSSASSSSCSSNNCGTSFNRSMSVCGTGSSCAATGGAAGGQTRRGLSKSASVRITVIDAVGSLRRKISSTAQLMSQGSLSAFSNNIAARRRSMRIAANTPPRCQHRQIKMHSPFEFVTPEKRKMDRKWCDTETPTKLRREVEALTADMQALASLTPNTLRTRAAARRESAPSPKNKMSRSRKFESLI